MWGCDKGLRCPYAVLFLVPTSLRRLPPKAWGQGLLVSRTPPGCAAPWDKERKHPVKVCGSEQGCASLQGPSTP